MGTRSLLSSVVVSLLLSTTGGCGGASPTSPPPPVAPQPIVEPGPPQPTGPAPRLGIVRILAFGDSMTEGVDSPPLPSGAFSGTLLLGPGRAQSYPFKLQSMIDTRYTDQVITVFNEGIAGKQVRDDRERFNQAMSQARPDLILLLEGANDLGGPLAPGEGVNARITVVVGSLEDMVRDAGFRGIPVMIGTLPPQRPGAPKATTLAVFPRINAAIVEMAGKKGAQVVDIGQLPLSMIGADGLHPSEAGYQRMAEIWFDAIKARFEPALQ
jgi:lysophospholipase L1-like esterase